MSAEPIILGLDLSTKLNGYCAGPGNRTPVAGAFELFERRDLGRLGCEVQDNILRLHRRFCATHWIVEAPLLTPRDHLWTLRRQYGVSFLVATLATKLKVVCEFVAYDEIKAELGGRGASKDDQVAAALRIGVSLPDTIEGGRRDAADGVGAWKIGVRKHAKHHLQHWDQALYSGIGGLL